ncbi:MAG: NADH-quinone oxidoreductase subunit C [Deltaproteobacteria bacterium]|nr:NADH-quinone oxidoreductase subunit C [Deltaproteobacteria bacterium]
MIAPLQNADCLFLSKENQAKVGYEALAVVEADTLLPLARDFLAAGYHLEDISGLVTRDGAVSAYHFAHFDIPGRAEVLVIAPLDNPSFPSIAAVYQSAEWHERETRDFFGFQYEGNPNFIPLLLSEDMVDVHPLLKAEGSLASLASIFSAEGREREVVKQAEGFTLLDAPVTEEPAPKVAEAPKADAPQKAESPVTPEAKPESKPEAEAQGAADSGQEGAGDA